MVLIILELQAYVNGQMLRVLLQNLPQLCNKVGIERCELSLRVIEREDPNGLQVSSHKYCFESSNSAKHHSSELCLELYRASGTVPAPLIRVVLPSSHQADCWLGEEPCSTF